MVTVSARVHGRGGGGNRQESRRLGQVRRGTYPDHLLVQTRRIKKARAPGNVSHHVGRQSDAVPSTPVTAGWSRTEDGSVVWCGRTHSVQFRESRRESHGTRDKKKLETQGPSHSRDGGQEEGDLVG